VTLPAALDLIPLQVREKAPRDARWTARAYTREEVEHWRSAGGNVGARLGDQDLVLDYDPRRDIIGDSLERLLRDVGIDPATCPTTVTPSGGRHLFLRKPAGLRVRGKDLPDYEGVEVKSVGRQVVAPPSTHPLHLQGPPYRRDESRPDYSDAPEATPKLLEIVCRPPRVARERIGDPDLSAAWLARILDAIPVEKFSGNDAWEPLMMGCVAACGADPECQEVFVSWSLSDPSYAGDEDEIRARWDSVDPEGERGPGTFWKLVTDAAGGREHLPGPPPSDILAAFGMMPVPVEALAPGAEAPATPSEAPTLLILERTQSGRPMPTNRNAISALAWLDLGFAWNDRAGVVHIQGDISALEEKFPGFSRVLGKGSGLALRAWLIAHCQLDLGLDKVYEAAETLARRRPFDPVKLYLDGLLWDGTPRIDGWLHRYAGAPDTDYVRGVGRHLLVSAVARALVPGVKVDEVVVLEGAQGIGKSTLVRILGGDYTVEDIPARSLGDRDVVESIRNAWVVELGELDALNRAEVSSVKMFLSKQVDRARLAYERLAEDYPRRCVFVGTTNEGEYLQDMTGNRRFLPVRIGRVAIEDLRADRDQLYAEAVGAWREAEASGQGARFPEALLAAAAVEQEARTVGDPWEERLDAFAASNPEQVAFGSAEMLFALGVTPANQTPALGRRLSRVLAKMGWTQAKVGDAARGADKRVRGYRRPSGA